MEKLNKPHQEFVVSRVIKQGNSLCIRIPFRVTRYLGIKENSFVGADIVNYDKIELPKEFVDCYLKVPALEKYRREQVKNFLLLMNLEKMTGKNTAKDSEYRKFKNLVLKNKKEIKVSLYNTPTYKKYNKK